MVWRIKDNAVTRAIITVIVVPLCAFLVLVPYSLLLRWNGFTMFLFWFIILPGIVLYLNSKFSKEYRVWRPMVSLIIFYAFMAFMIYKHYRTDYFIIMMISFGWNLGIMAIVLLVERADRISPDKDSTAR